MTHCSHCGALLTPGARACDTCGSHPALADPPGGDAVCVNCSTPIAVSWRHCAACGTATAEAESPRVVRTSISDEARKPPTRPEPPDEAPDDEDQPMSADDQWPAQLHR